MSSGGPRVDRGGTGGVPRIVGRVPSVGGGVPLRATSDLG